MVAFSFTVHGSSCEIGTSLSSDRDTALLWIPRVLAVQILIGVIQRTQVLFVLILFFVIHASGAAKIVDRINLLSFLRVGYTSHAASFPRVPIAWDLSIASPMLTDLAAALAGRLTTALAFSATLLAALARLVSLALFALINRAISIFHGHSLTDTSERNSFSGHPRMSPQMKIVS
jgi:hypothetical protein